MSTSARSARCLTALAVCGVLGLALFTVRVRAEIVVGGRQLDATRRAAEDLQRRAQALSVQLEERCRWLVTTGELLPIPAVPVPEMLPGSWQPDEASAPRAHRALGGPAAIAAAGPARPQHLALGAVRR